ncbi:15244_t:CDS:1, partial [Funneliformis mosseae]
MKRTESGEIQKLTEDVVILSNYLELVVKPVATIDGGYAIIYANTTKTPLNDPFLPQGGIYAMFLTYGQSYTRQPVVIYQTQISNLSFTGLNCDIAYVGFGQICILTGFYIDQPAPNTFFIRVDFLSSGTLYNVQSLNATAVGVTEYKLRALRYGGYILMGIKEQTTTNDAAQRSMY